MTLHDSSDRTRKVSPVALMLRKGPLASCRQLIDPSSSSADLKPTARDKPAAFEPVERRIQRAFGQIKRPVTAGPQCFGDGVPVSRPLAKDSKK
jgi:hypothetical protein